MRSMSIRIVGCVGLPFRRPINGSPTSHLFIDGCGLSRFKEHEIATWISTLSNVGSVTLVAQRSFLYISCESIPQAQALREQLLRDGGEDHSIHELKHKTVNASECDVDSPQNANIGDQNKKENIVNRILLSIERLEFAVQCRWLDVPTPSPEVFISSDDVLLSNHSSCPIEGLSVHKIKSGHNLDDFKLELDKLNWNKALRKREFIVGMGVEAEEATSGQLDWNLEQKIPSGILEKVEMFWKNQKNLLTEKREQDSQILQCNYRPTQTSIHLSSIKQKPYLFRESNVLFEDVIAFLSIGDAVGVWFYSAESNKSFCLKLKPDHLLIISVSPPIVKSPLRSYLVVFRRRRNDYNRIPLKHAIDRIPAGTKTRVTKQMPSNKSCPSVHNKLLDNFDELASKEKFEEVYVHNIYDRIASHFSHTRYRPWPKVQAFLESFPAGSIILDCGCGNGKYSECNPNIVWVGSDRSGPLLHCVVTKSLTKAAPLDNSFEKSIQNIEPHLTVKKEVFVGDCLNISLKNDAADACLSIAVIHHLSTEDKRVRAVEELLRCLRPGGKLLIYVWAMEQEEGTIGARKFETQDVFVPWHLQKHLDGIMKSELQVSQAEEEGMRRRCAMQEKQHDSKFEKQQQSNPELVTLYRYYHVFRRDEIQQLCEKAKNGRVIDISFDSNNWVVKMERI